MSDTKKYRDFVDEPIGDKPVARLPGVGPILGKTLDEKGFDKAYVVLGQYLILNKNQMLFQKWMKGACSATPKQSADCYRGLQDWCNKFMY